MTKYKAKSAIVGRKKRPSKDTELYPCFVHLFSINEPHKSGEVPEKMLEFEEVHKVVITGLDVQYLLPGNDIVINDLEYLELQADGPHIFLKGRQKKE